MSQPSVLDRIAASIEWPRVRSDRALWFIGAVVIGCPLAFGGAPAVTVPVFALLAALAFLVSGVERRGLRSDHVVPVMLAMALMFAVHLTPLPPALLRVLDPGSEAASRWVLGAFGVDRATAWRPMHHDPGTGINDFVYFVGLVCMYLASYKLSARDERPTVIHLCAASALTIALLAITHVATDQIKVYGVYTPAHAGPPILSPMLNANHLAALTGAGAILWAGMAVESPKGFLRVLRSLCAVASGVVCAMSLSRGGVVSAVGAMAIFVGLNARREVEDPMQRGIKRRDDSKPRRKPETFFGALIGGLVLAAGLYVGASSLAQEYAHGDASKLDNFRRALGLLRGHELLGVGSGGIVAAAASSGRLDPHWTFLRVESLPIDLLVAFGGVVALLAIVQLGRALRAWMPPSIAAPTVVGAWCAMLSLVAHDMVDFSFYLGGVGYVVAALAGALAGFRLRGWGTTLKRDPRSMRWTAVVPLALIALCGVQASHSTLESDRDLFERSLRGRSDFYRTPEARDALVRHPADAYLQLLSGAYAVARHDPEALRFVGRAIEISPGWAEPHILLARLLAARGLRSQAMLETRAALSRSHTVATSGARILASLHPPPDEQEIDRTAPPGPTGLEFLESLARETYNRDAHASTLADVVQLRRDPTALGALQRQASISLGDGDRVTADGFCARMLTGHPRNPAGYRCRAGVQERGGYLTAAMQTLDNALARVDDVYLIRMDRARIYSLQREAPGVRRETDAMVELAGADIQRKIEAHALRGRYEAELGNDRLAFSAYEMANALALPERPYLLPMLLLAVRLRDGSFVERACQELMDVTPPDPQAVQACEHRAPQAEPARTTDGVNP